VGCTRICLQQIPRTRVLDIPPPWGYFLRSMFISDERKIQIKEHCKNEKIKEKKYMLYFLHKVHQR
jgi:hypothetical protein